jgi:hypothetical protein
VVVVCPGALAVRPGVVAALPGLVELPGVLEVWGTGLVLLDALRPLRSAGLPAETLVVVGALLDSPHATSTRQASSSADAAAAALTACIGLCLRLITRLLCRRSGPIRGSDPQGSISQRSRKLSAPA